MPVTATTDLPDAQQPSLGNGVEDEIAVSWADVSNYGNVDIQVREVDDSDNADPAWQDWAAVDAASASSDIITNREDGEAYEVRIRTRTEHVTGAWTAASSIITKFPGATGVTVDATSETSITLLWSDNSDNEDGFIVERRERFRSGWGEWRERADLAPNTTSHTDSVLPDTTYQYRIRAYTEETTATSSSIETTSSDDGVPTGRTPAQGDHVVVETPSGATLTPTVVDSPRLNQRLNGLPTVEIPVAKHERWSDTGIWEDQPIEVYQDGERLQVEQLDRIEQQADRDILVGVGGVDLRERVQLDVIERDAHLVAGDVLGEVGVIGHVDDPATDTTPDALLEEVDSQAAWADRIDAAPNDLFEAADGALQTRQTAYFMEAEAGENNGGSTSVDAPEDTWSNEFVTLVADPSSYLDVTAETDHVIPASEIAIAVRIQHSQDGHVGFDVNIDGSTVATVPANTYSAGSDTPEWVTPVAAGDVATDLAADNHTITINIDGSDSDLALTVDCLTLYDARQDPGLTESVSGGVIEGPDLYPTGVQVETDDVPTVRQVTGGRLDAQAADTGGSFAVALSNDSGATWPLSASNTTTVEGEFSESSASLRVRFTLGGIEGDTSTSPAGRTQPQTVDSYSLYADLLDTPLLVNRSFDGDAVDILNEIADAGDFIWELAWDESADAPVVEWTQPGQRTASIDAPLSDYDISTDYSSVYRKAVIKGTLVDAGTETFSVSATDTPEDVLQHDYLSEVGETVTSTDGTTVFERGADYELYPTSGEIEILSSGDMAAGTDYQIEYERHLTGSYEAPDYDAATDRTLVESLPAVTTERNAEQAALIAVKTSSEPIQRASVTIDALPSDVLLVEALGLEGLPIEAGLEVWDVRSSRRSTTLQLGTRDPVDERLSEFESRLSAVSGKV
jgi:hypothetical protein